MLKGAVGFGKSHEDQILESFVKGGWREVTARRTGRRRILARKAFLLHYYI